MPQNVFLCFSLPGFPYLFPLVLILGLSGILNKTSHTINVIIKCQLLRKR
jgi:hypothetical protein